MNWTKIPTDLLESRTPDKELIAILKYQLLWASLERQPDKIIALRFMSEKQYELAMQYLDSIKKQIDIDIRHVCKHRNCQKLYYDKKQTLSEESDNQCDDQCDSHTERADKIREDNKKEIYKESFEEFWKVYPKQRAGSRQKAYTSYCRVLKENRCTVDKLLSSARAYALSDEVKRGFAKGCAAWLNDDRFNVEYNHSNSFGNWDNF